MGDYNMIPGDDRVNFNAISPGSGGDEFLRFISSESLTGMTSHISGCDPLRGNLLDGFAISAAHTSEYVADSLRLLSLDDPAFAQPSGAPVTCVNYRGFISDHFPLVARFRAASDDD